MLDFTASSLFASIFFGIIGMWMFRQGKRFADFRIIGIAVALMAYPYFVQGPLLDWGVGFALCGAAYYYWRG
jgi:ABC-type dipeptide/oligopeptide/nickel transport system permease component